MKWITGISKKTLLVGVRIFALVCYVPVADCTRAVEVPIEGQTQLTYEEAYQALDSIRSQQQTAVGELESARVRRLQSDQAQAEAQRQFEGAQRDVEAAKAVDKRFEGGRNVDALRQADQTLKDAEQRLAKAKKTLEEKNNDFDKAQTDYIKANDELERLEKLERNQARLVDQIGAGGRANTTTDAVDATQTPPLPGLAGLTLQVARALQLGRTALDDIQQALKNCDRIRFDMARTQLQSALTSIAGVGDFELLGQLDVSLGSLRAAFVGALNELVSRWKALEATWSKRCGDGATCVSPENALLVSAGQDDRSLLGGNPGSGSGSPSNPPPGSNQPDPNHNPDPIDPKLKPQAGGGATPAGSGAGGFAGGQASCSETAEVAFYRGWLSENEEQIQEREALLENPDAGPQTKETAARQLETLYERRDYLEDEIRSESEKECQRQQILAQDQAAQQARFQAQLRAPSPGEEFDWKMKRGQLENLKASAEKIVTRAREMQETLNALQNRITDVDREIAELEENIADVWRAMDPNNYDPLQIQAKIKVFEDRINELKRVRGELARSIQRHQRAYQTELAQLRADYQYNLWIVSPEAFRLSEIQRIAEYRDVLLRTQETRQISDAAFEKKIKEIEVEIEQAEAAGDATRADQLRRELENVKASRRDWDTFYENKERNMARELEDIRRRNHFESVGPSSDRHFQDLWVKYKLPGEPLGPLLGQEDKDYITQKVYLFADGARGRSPEDNRPWAIQVVTEISIRSSVKAFPGYVRGLIEGTVEGVVGFGSLILGTADVFAESIALALGAQDGSVFGTDALETVNSLVTAGPDLIPLIANAVIKTIDDTIKTGDVRMVGRGVGNFVLAELMLAPVVAQGTRAARQMVAGIATRVEHGLGVVRIAQSGADEVAEAAAIASAAGRTVDEVGDAARLGSSGARAADAAASSGLTAGLNIDGTPGPGFNRAHLEGIQQLADEIGETIVVFGSRQTGVSVHTGGPFTPKSDIDIGVIGGMDNLSNLLKGNPESVIGWKTDVAGMWPSASDIPAALGPVIIVSPRSSIEFVSDTGAKVSFKGIPLGKPGSGSSAYVNADDTSKVVRVTKGYDADFGTADPTGPMKLDEIGREAVEGIVARSGYEAPVRMVKRYQRHVPADLPTDPNALRGKIISAEVTERMQQGTITDILKRQGGTLTQGQSEAIDGATRFINKAGFAWTDVHGGNWTLEPLYGNDKWRVVIIDPGGIVPAKGSTLVERAANARTIQSSINNPNELFVEMAKEEINRGLLREYMAKDLVDTRGNMIDETALGGLKVDDIGMSPAGFVTPEFEEVRRLFAMTPDEAAAYYANKLDALPTPTRTGVPFTGAALAGSAFNLVNQLASGQGPLAVMTSPTMMCWHRLYPPFFSPSGASFVRVDTHNPGFFEHAQTRDGRISIMEEDKSLRGDLADEKSTDTWSGSRLLNSLVQ